LAFCGLFAHLFNRAIGGGEVQLSIRIADQCGGKLLPGLARDLALSKIELVVPVILSGRSATRVREPSLAPRRIALAASDGPL
jgi:hypothetical protein